MERRSRLMRWALIIGLAFVASGCGGGGGSSGSVGSGQGGPSVTPTITPTRTPLRPVSGRNERTQTSPAGAITIRFADIRISGGTTTDFSVVLADSRGVPVANQTIEIFSGSGVEVVSPIDGAGTTRADGTLAGTVRGVSGGTFAVTARAPEPPFDGLEVTITVIVDAPPAITETPGPTVTPTVVSCEDVSSIIVQTDTLNVSSQQGGEATITAVVFDSNNLPVPQLNVLFDLDPRIAVFEPLVGATDGDGMAQSQLTIPPNSTFGNLTVTASACEVTGEVEIEVVSGVSTKPVTTVVLQADPATVGSDAGGTINLKAAVLDADNAPIDGIDVLFITAVGNVNPLIDRTQVSGSEAGVASSVLQVPVGAIVQPYTVTALAGGVSGSTTVNIVPGRVAGTSPNPGVPPGEPAAISLGASPSRIQVQGSGGTDLSTIIGRVFDNNGAPLAGVPVRFHVVPEVSAPGALVLPVTQDEDDPQPAEDTLCSSEDPVAISDVAGFAVIQLRAGPAPGPVSVFACADTVEFDTETVVTAQQALVTVTSGPVARIGLSINPRFIDLNDGSYLATATALVIDAQGNTVEDGTPVFFEILTRQVCLGGVDDGQVCADDGDCDGGICASDPDDPAGDVALSSNTTTNADPPCDVSQYVVQTGIPVSRQPGDAITCVKFPVRMQGSEIQVRASVGGVSNNPAGEPVALPGSIADLAVSVNPQPVTVTDSADGLAVVHATAFDDFFDGVENVRFRFVSSIGSIDRSVLTDANGDAFATWTVPAGTSSGSATVRVGGGGMPLLSIPVEIENIGGSTGPTPTPGLAAAAIRFFAASPDTIGVRGSGLPEQSTLTFQVTDGFGGPVANTNVDFSIARIADESIAPASAVTDENGNVRVVLTSGRRALSVQVTAQVNEVAPALTTRSTAVNILGGPPSQPNFTVNAEFLNISGGVTFGLENEIVAFAADRFGNPVPPGTAVSFTTQGGAVGDPKATGVLGQANATLVSQEPLPANGIVSTLATTRGERPFTDMNGNGVCDGTDVLQIVPEPFFDSNCNGTRDEDEDFIDVNDDGQFNNDQILGSPACDDQIVVFDSVCTTFSSGTRVLLLPDGSGPLEAGGSRSYTLIVSDNPDPIGNPGVGNPVVGGSVVSVRVDGDRGRVLGLSSFSIPDAMTNNQIVGGVSRFGFTVSDDNPEAETTDAVAVIVEVQSDVGSLPAGGNGSVTVQDFVTFQAAPTPTPTATHTSTPLPTATPTQVPPSVAPQQATLAAGSGAPPTACNGASQTFVVTGGSPPFEVFAGGGCVSVTSVPSSGGSFVYTAGNTAGDFTITVTDAQGKLSSAGVRINPPATSTPEPTATSTPEPTAPPTATL